MISANALNEISQQRYLAGVHDVTRRVLHLQPDDVAVLQVQTSDQAHYGFWITSVHIERGDATLEVGGHLLDELDNEITGDLSSLDWDRLVGEDKVGNGTIRVSQTSHTGAHEWISLDVEALREYLLDEQDRGEPEGLAEWGLNAIWGTVYDRHADYGNTITNLLGELDEKILSSGIGARAAVDGLYTDGDAGHYLRVYVSLPGELRIADKPREVGDIVPADVEHEHPGIERMVQAVAEVIRIANQLLDNLFTVLPPVA